MPFTAFLVQSGRPSADNRSIAGHRVTVGIANAFEDARKMVARVARVDDTVAFLVTEYAINAVRGEHADNLKEVFFPATKLPRRTSSSTASVVYAAPPPPVPPRQPHYHTFLGP